MKAHFVSRALSITCAIVISGLCLIPALAGTWETSREYVGNRWSHSGVWIFGDDDECPFDWQAAWEGSATSSANTGDCVPVASAGTTGIIKATLTWVPGYPGEPPPAQVWLYEDVKASWSVWSGVCNVSGDGTAFNSSGDRYTITTLNYGGRRARIDGEARCTRYSKVDGSSGTIFRQYRLGSSGKVWLDCTLTTATC